MEVDEALSRLGKFGKWQMITYSLVCLSVTMSGCWHMMVIVFTVMEVDEALSRLGRFSKWQMITFSLVCLSVNMSTCWHMMVIVFAGGEPNHHCKLPADQRVNESIPREQDNKGQWHFSSCHRYVNLSISNATMKCEDGWTYDDEFESTIVTEWDLVCDKNYLVETSQSVFAFGVMVGAIVFTTLADKIGRKPVHLGCQWAMIVIGLAIAFVPEYITFVILRFLLGAVREGAGLTGIVMACELFPASQRTFAGTALELFWASAWMILALIAYLITNWRHLQLAVTLPPVATIALIWFLPESIPWLAANGKHDEAEKVLKKAAKANGIYLPEVILRRDTIHVPRIEDKAEDVEERRDSGVQVNEQTPLTQRNSNDASKDKSNTLPSNGDIMSGQLPEEMVNSTARLADTPQKIAAIPHEDIMKEEHVYTCLDILRSQTMVLNTFIMCSLWFASGVVYYGLSLSTSTLAGDKYVNFFLSGAVEAPAYLMTVFVLQKFGRRWPLCLFHVIAGIVLFIGIFIPDEASGHDLVPLIITLSMVGKFCMTAAFGTVVLYAPEIYPTNLRNFGFGMASVWGRIGAMIAPFSAYVGKRIPWIPGAVFAVVSVSTGILALLLPETLDRPLPETIEEIETWKRTVTTEEKEAIRKNELSYNIRLDKLKPDSNETAI